MKLTFKNYVPTGRYASFETQQCDIKRNKCKVGSIAEASHFTKISSSERISISFIVIDEKEKCGWRWLTLKTKFSNMEDAKIFIKEREELIQKQFNLFELK